jgi:hypothetical protein
MEAATLLQYLTAPREGHLQEVFRILDTCFPTSSMAFDESETAHDMNWVYQTRLGWVLPGSGRNGPAERARKAAVKTVTMICYVDSDHVG